MENPGKRRKHAAKKPERQPKKARNWCSLAFEACARIKKPGNRRIRVEIDENLEKRRENAPTSCENLKKRRKNARKSPEQGRDRRLKKHPKRPDATAVLRPAKAYQKSSEKPRKAPKPLTSG